MPLLVRNRRSRYQPQPVLLPLRSLCLPSHSCLTLLTLSQSTKQRSPSEAPVSSSPRRTRIRHVITDAHLLAIDSRAWPAAWLGWAGNVNPRGFDAFCGHPKPAGLEQTRLVLVTCDFLRPACDGHHVGHARGQGVTSDLQRASHKTFKVTQGHIPVAEAAASASALRRRGFVCRRALVAEMRRGMPSPRSAR